MRRFFETVLVLMSANRNTGIRACVLRYMMLIAAVVYLQFVIFLSGSAEWSTQRVNYKSPAQSDDDGYRPTCRNDVYGFRPVLDRIEIAPSRPGPKILCYVNTHEEYHNTRVQAVIDTWGPSCDGLVFASNKTDEMLGAVRINTSHEYKDLWNKHRETLRYVYETYRDEYEWFFKADDDTYVILENLREYLDSPIIRNQHNDGVPFHIGNPHDYSVDGWHGVYDAHRNFYDRELLSDFLRMSNDRYTFNVGGAGYAMNLAFLERFMDWIERQECSFDRSLSTQLDDGMLSFCSAHFGVLPYQNTRDSAGRERFHQFNPFELNKMGPEDKLFRVFNSLKRLTGGLQTGEECCSSKSITFHRLKPKAMRYVHDVLHMCREQHEHYFGFLGGIV